MDVTAVALAALVAAAAALDALETGRLPEGYVVAGSAVAVVGCAALWWRRRWPVGVALLLLPMAAFTEFVGGAALVAVFTVAVHRRWPVAAGIAALHFLAPVPYTLIWPDPVLTTVGSNAVGLALLAVAVAWGTAVRSRRELLASLRERATRAEAEAELHAERSRSLERDRIAREMHDVLAHRISMVSLHAGALEVRPGLPTEDVARAAGTIRASAHQALEDLREILGLLREGDDGTGLRPQPGLGDLDELVAEARSTGTPVRLEDLLPDTAAVPSRVSRTAYRVVQEGLTNARKHAPGCEVQVRLAGAPGGELHVSLRNRLPTGPPPPIPIPGSRSGLLGLAERVSLVGGRTDHCVRRETAGVIAFHLEAWLPWPT